MLKLNTKMPLLLILVAALLAFSSTACNTDGDDGEQSQDEEGAYKKENILPDAYKFYVGKNLEEAHEYAEDLVKDAEALCGTKQPKYKCEEGNSPLDCVQHDWVELTEYATKRLQIFNKYIDFQQSVFDKLDKHQPLADIKNRVSTNPEDVSSGFDSLPVLEAVIYDATGAAPAKGNNQCKFLLKSAAAIRGHVSELESVWKQPENKALFVQEGKTDAALKKLFKAMQETFDEVNKDSFAAPAGLDTDGGDSGTADASKTEAPFAKRGGWVVFQVVSRGPLGLYNGTYKVKPKGNTFSKSTLEAYVKTLEGGTELNTKILDDYKKLIEKFDAGLQKGDEGLEAGITAGNKKEDIKAIIAIIKEIASDFGTASSKTP